MQRPIQVDALIFFVQLFFTVLHSIIIQLDCAVKYTQMIFYPQLLKLKELIAKFRNLQYFNFFQAKFQLASLAKLSLVVMMLEIDHLWLFFC